MLYRMMITKYPLRSWERAMSARSLATGVIGLAVVGVAIVIPQVFVFFALGLGGAICGYLFQKAQDNHNPFLVLRTAWNLRRSHVLLAHLIVGLGVSSFILGQGVLLSQASPFIGLLCKSGAYAVFAFSLSYVCFGFVSISRAKHQLLGATNQRLHLWRTAALKSRKRNLMA